MKPSWAAPASSSAHPAWRVSPVSVDPLREVVEVLAIPLPLEPWVIRVRRPAFGQRLSDPQASCGGVTGAFIVPEAADPALTLVIISMASEDEMNLVDDLLRELMLAEPQRVADRKRVGPEIPPWFVVTVDPRSVDERVHQPASRLVRFPA